jgi:hypothetical protein
MSAQPAIPINWWKLLDRLENEGPYSQLRIHAKTLSADWVTCAVGNHCAGIPRREESNAPYDELLFNLGVVLYRRIENEEYDEARDQLMRIEQRAAEILREMAGEDPA